MSAIQAATDAQRAASDPRLSAFVSASAGSGKTKLLVDRLLRLMLDGADPSRILCLTFTRTAAAEMRTRLQDTLGAWVALSNRELDEHLKLLGVVSSLALRQRARELFARVLDLPGGMRIDTIHGFCQSLLRRFPLEASLSPRFRVMEERDAAVALHDARERLVGGALDRARAAAVEHVAGLCRPVDFGRLVTQLDQDRGRLAAARSLGAELPDAIRRVLGVTRDDADEAIQAAVMFSDDDIRQAAKIAARDGAPTVKANAALMLDWLGRTSSDRARRWTEWAKLFLTAEGSPRASSTFVNAKLQLDPQTFLDEADRIRAVNRECAAIRVAAATVALLTLADPVLDDVADAKQAAGLLDYADLIGRTAGLLHDPGSAWVLFKLDGGIDHLLLDEVQDTSPEQWKIAHDLTAEFFTGDGARPGNRTVFAVGDRKQSIFSFQGADPNGFDTWRGRIETRAKAAGHQFLASTLDVSFRSAGPVLALVDRVFSNADAAAGVSGGDPLAHVASREGHAGKVELWPLTPKLEKQPQKPLRHPDGTADIPAPQQLANRLAEWIADQLADGVMLDSKGRPLRPGDIMILLQRRGTFAPALVGALKARGVPVAGLDRMKLTAQPAVADLLALCDVLLLPDDDLSLACVLTSPLGGCSDDSLMALGMERSANLFATLRARAGERPEWAAVSAFIASLLARVDYASPHALLAEALGPLGGRARLLARLGEEAADPIDELLSAALTFATEHPPSLQGFLRWLRLSDAEAKREPEGAGGLVRVMTVHGAKGLQAPFVILPDTTQAYDQEGALSWLEDSVTGVEIPVWVPRKEFRNDATEASRLLSKDARAEERNRLLYVALTRAEDRLLVCGWETKSKPPNTWYAHVAAGFSTLDARSFEFEHWAGDHLVHDSPQIAAPSSPQAVAKALQEKLPAWAGRQPDWRPAPPPPEPARPSPLAPSRPEGVELGPVPRAASPVGTRDALGGPFKRGALIHSLLQHLPNLPPADRRAAAARWLAAPGQGASAVDAAAIADEIMAILDHPELTEIFGPGSRAEVPLTGFVDGAVVGGLVDRLAVLPGRVLVADYKTGRDAPEDVADTPVLYLRQMAAYRGVLKAIYGARPVVSALVWTRTGRVTVLPDSLLDGCLSQPTPQTTFVGNQGAPSP